MSPMDICHVCKKEEMTGSIFGVRLRTSKEKEHVIEGPMTCDECQRGLMVLIKHADIAKFIIQAYKEEKNGADKPAPAGSS